MDCVNLVNREIYLFVLSMALQNTTYRLNFFLSWDRSQSLVEISFVEIKRWSWIIL